MSKFRHELSGRKQTQVLTDAINAERMRSDDLLGMVPLSPDSLLNLVIRIFPWISCQH